MSLVNNCCGCLNPYFLGCITHCEEKLKFPIVAPQTGVYTLFVDTGDTIITVTAKDFLVGEDLLFDVSELNENYHYQNAYILDTNGNRLKFTDDCGTYNCFSFIKKIGIEL